MDIFQPRQGRRRLPQSEPTLPLAPAEPEILPTTLVVDYTNTYDITTIDTLIKKVLARNPIAIAELDEKLTILRNELAKCRTVVGIKQYQEQIAELEKERRILATERTLESYNAEAAKIVERFAALPVTRKVVSMLDNNNKSTVLTPAEELKKRTIDEYLAVAKRYFPLKINYPIVERTTSTTTALHCNSCFNVIISDKYSIRGHLICNHCKAENRVAKLPTASTKDYDTYGNLLKSINRDCCTQLINFDGDILVKKLDEYFAAKGMPTSKDYKLIPLNSHGRKDGTDHMIIMDAMRDLGYRDHYKNYLYVCHLYFGWSRADNISRYIPKIEEHFRATQYVWEHLMDESEKEGRTSSLPVEYRKLKHYQLLFPCDRSMVDLSTAAKTINQYDRIWRIMCERADHPEIYFIPT